MKNTDTLDELRDAIIEAIKAGTIEQEYPLWLYDCRVKYGISSYSLQVLISFYKDVLSEPLIVVPYENSNHFVTSENIYIEHVTHIDRDKNLNLQKKTKRWIILPILCGILILYCIIIAQNEYKNLAIKSESEINQLQNEIKSLNESLLLTDSLYDKVVNMNHIIGASYKDMEERFDSSWVMWLSAKHPVKITSFYIKANNKGFIELGLYDNKSKLISSTKVSVYKKQLKLVTPKDFIITTPGLYYLAIKKSNGISLSYHPSNSIEYNHFKDDALQIIACEYNEHINTMVHNQQNYYQYFYDITYNLIRENFIQSSKKIEESINSADTIDVIYSTIANDTLP